jgi:hypothetical protein
MPAAILGPVIGGVVAAGGAVAAASIGSSASNRASQAASRSADQAAQVQRETYAQNQAALAPWQQSGLQANALLNDFYGIPQAPARQLTPPVMGSPMGTPMGREDFSDRGLGFRGMGGFNAANVPVSGTEQDEPAAQPPPPNSRDAFRRFIENSDYGFQFGEGANQVNSGYAGAGALKSGAAMSALERMRQNLQQGYRGEWAGGVGNQQGVGFAAASAQAGVGQNYANSLSNIYQNQGANAANAALLRGQNSANMVNSLGTIGGNIAGQIFRPPPPVTAATVARLTPDVTTTIATNPGFF